MEKYGLGRGLAALIPGAGLLEEEEERVQEISVNAISPNPYQPRTAFDPEKMEELVDSVRQHGILQPILVRRTGIEHFELVAGERRFRAAQAAGLKTLPAFIRDFTDQEQLEIAIVENLQREDIGPVETARAFKRLMDEFHMTQEAVAQRTGKSRGVVSNMVRLLTLPEEILESLQIGEITEGHARAFLMVAEDWRRVILWQQIRGKNLTVREVEKRARGLQEQLNSAEVSTPPLSERQTTPADRHSPPAAVDPHITDITDKLQQALGTKVTLRQSSGGSGRVEIEYYSDQERERLIELLLNTVR